jgi:hypothetical protein
MKLADGWWTVVHCTEHLRPVNHAQCYEIRGERTDKFYVVAKCYLGGRRLVNGDWELCESCTRPRIPGLKITWVEEDLLMGGWGLWWICIGGCEHWRKRVLTAFSGGPCEAVWESRWDTRRSRGSERSEVSTRPARGLFRAPPTERARKWKLFWICLAR